MNAPFPHPQASPAVVAAAEYRIIDEGGELYRAWTDEVIFNLMGRLGRGARVENVHTGEDVTRQKARAWFDANKYEPCPASFEPFVKDDISDRARRPYVDPNREHSTWHRGAGGVL